MLAEKESFLKLLVIGLCVLATWACSGSKNAEPLPSQTITQVAPQLATPPPPLPPRSRESRLPRPTLKVIDAGESVLEPKTLLEASQLAKARKGETGESVAVINDDNLHEYAEGADVIILESPPAAPEPELEPPSNEEKGSELRDEQYWRSRALELRMGWRRTIDRISELELESAALRQQFYAEDDPYLRDSQLKPAWDRVLDRLEQLRSQATRYEQDVEIFVTEGQRSSTPQGWLNQGWELEPTPEEKRNLDRSGQSIEPPILDQDNEPEEVDQ